MKASVRTMLATACAMLTVPAAADDLQGVVRGADGRPIPGARVVVDDLMRGTTTGRDGIYRIPALPAGDYAVSASGFGVASDRRRAVVPPHGPATLDFVLGPNLALQRAAAANGEPKVEHQRQKDAYLASIRPVQGRPPNVLLILFDDLGAGDLSSYGNRLIKTPNIDAVAQRGVRLDSFYSSSPVCTPSRAAIMTGRLPTRSLAANHVFFPTGHPMVTVRHAAGWANALPADEILLPEILSRAGYATGAFGKWHLGDTPGHRPTERGFKDYFGILYSNDMDPATLWRGTTVDTPGASADQATFTERFTDEAIGFIRANATRPFFAYVPYTAPHVPHVPNPKHKGVSEGGTYGDVVEDLDTNVGRLLRTLDELKIADNTIIIVTSDNGGDFGGSVGDLRGRKGETFEGGQRVPAFVVWPGVTRPGTRTSQMAMNIDFFPSLLANLHIPLPADRTIDGADFRGLLGGANSPHDYLYYVTTFSGEYQAVRDREGYKYRELLANASPFAPTGEPQPNKAPTGSLYDLNRDDESHDLTARHPGEASRLKAALESLRAQAAANPRGWVAGR